MKKIVLALFCVFNFFISNAQSNDEIAGVYIRRAMNAIEESLDYKKAGTLFEKAVKYQEIISSPKVAKLGSEIYFELGDFRASKKYSKLYFSLAKNKTSEEYMNQLDLSVTIDEELEVQIAEEERIAVEKRKKQQELQRIDSLKTVWTNRSNTLSIKADSIYKFDKNNFAIFKLNDRYGILNDKGEIIIEANGYSNSISNDGFILLTNSEKNAIRIYCFNTNTATGFLLPAPSEFNPISTHYGEIMLPRGNGRLITYPNNSSKPLVYDLLAKKFVRVSNKEGILKELKRKEIIEKYNKEGQLKINKVWYEFGGHIGGGIIPLNSENSNNIHSFLCSIDGTVLFTASDYKYIGAEYKNKFEARYEGEQFWINPNGTKVSDPKNEAGKYKGNSIIKKLESGNYQIMQEGIIVLGSEQLEKLPDFLRKFAN